MNGGDGGIRTHGRFDTSTDFESVSLQPLRYVSIEKHSYIIADLNKKIQRKHMISLPFCVNNA